MDAKKIRKSIGRFFGWIGLIFCSFLARIIPGRYLYALANGISCLGYWIARKQRGIALESLSLAFGREKSKEEIEKIVQDCFSYMAKSGLEIMFLVHKPQLLKRRIEIIEKRYLDEALSRGRGVILVSAHFGNFPLLLARLSLQGYKTAGIIRPMRDSHAEKFFLKKRQQFNIKTIYSYPRQACVRQTIEALRNNEIVFIPLDQNFGTAGVFVDFFGRQAATATGPVIFAQRTKATILPCFIIRQADNRHKIIFEPPLSLETAQTPQEAVHLNIQKLTDIIEAYIRRYPAEWGWIHRRWKSQPQESEVVTC